MKPIKDILRKLTAAEQEIAAQKGEFCLFAFFLRENSIGDWDLVVAAPWLKTGHKESLDYIIQQVQGRLTKQEFLTLARVVILEWDNPAMEEIYDFANVEHGMVEVRDEDILGQTIKRGYIITSKKTQRLAA